MSQPEPLAASFAGRWRGTLRGMMVGLVLFALAVPLLLWNEGSTIVNVQNDNSKADIPFSVVTDPVQSVNEGRLVHMTGEVAPAAPAADPDLGLSLPVLKLQRQVETYQWIETGRTDDPPQATYAKAWSGPIADSPAFLQPEGHQNPAKARFTNWESASGSARLGAFEVPEDLVARFNPFETLRVTPEQLQSVRKPIRKDVRLQDGLLYFSEDPAKPKVGDTRIRYVAVKGGVISVMGRQAGSSLAPYSTQGGYTVYRVKPGTHSAEAMYAEAAPGSLLSLSTFLTWLFRAMAWSMMAMGLLISLERAGRWAETMPVVRDMLAHGPVLFAVTVAAGLSLSTIGFAWLAYSWWRGGLFLAIGIAVLVVLKRTGRRIRTERIIPEVREEPATAETLPA